MKRSIYILLVTVVYAVAGCTDIDKANPYDDQLHTLQVTAVYPDEYAEYLREGVTENRGCGPWQLLPDKDRQEGNGTILTDQWYIPHTGQRQEWNAYLQRTGRQCETGQQRHDLQSSIDSFQSRNNHYQRNLLRRMQKAATGRRLPVRQIHHPAQQRFGSTVPRQLVLWSTRSL